MMSGFSTMLAHGQGIRHIGAQAKIDPGSAPMGGLGFARAFRKFIPASFDPNAEPSLPVSVCFKLVRPITSSISPSAEALYKKILHQDPSLSAVVLSNLDGFLVSNSGVTEQVPLTECPA